MHRLCCGGPCAPPPPHREQTRNAHRNLISRDTCRNIAYDCSELMEKLDELVQRAVCSEEEREVWLYQGGLRFVCTA